MEYCSDEQYKCVLCMYTELLESKETFDKRTDRFKDYEKRFYEPVEDGGRLIHSIEYTEGYDKGSKLRHEERFYIYLDKDIFVHQIEFYDMFDLYGEYQDEEVYQKYTEGNELVEFDKYYKVITDENGDIITNDKGEYELLLYRQDGPSYIEYFDKDITLGKDGNNRGKIAEEKYFQNINEKPDFEKPYRNPVNEKILPHTIIYDMERQFDNIYTHYILETIPDIEGKDEETLLDIFDKLSNFEKNKFKELKNLEKYTRTDMEKLTDDDASKLLIKSENMSDRQYKHYFALAKIFLRKYIMINSEEKRRFKKEHKNNNSKNNVDTISSKNCESHLDYRGKIVPELLKGFAGSYRIPLSFILDDIENNGNRYSENYSKITVVDFSENQLLDSDTLMLSKIITKLSEINSNKLTINLTDNRFYGLLPQYREKLDPYLFEILRLEKVNTLIIIKNPISTDGGRHDFFIKVFKEELLHKLIYDYKVPSEEQIRKLFIDSNLTDDNQNLFIKITTETHEKYYKFIS